MSNHIRKVNVEYPGSVIFESVSRYLNANAIEIINQNAITSSYTIKIPKPYLLFNFDIYDSDDTTSITITIVESKNEPIIDNEAINNFINNISKYFEIVQDEELNKQTYDHLILDISKYVVKFQKCNDSELKNKFHTGYNRMGIILDQLESIGIIGFANGKKNQVLCDSFENLNKILIKNKIIKESELINDSIEVQKGGFFSFFKR